MILITGGLGMIGTNMTGLLNALGVARTWRVRRWRRSTGSWPSPADHGSSLLQCVLSGVPASDGSGPGPGLLVCRVAYAGAQRGQDGIVVRGAMVSRC